MIKINKFENVFGIKKLINGNKLGKTNVIYAPNGTAKSSFVMLFPPFQMAVNAMIFMGNYRHPLMK